jgi:hypothetical protein
MELDGLALSLRMDVPKPPKSNKQGLVRAELERHIADLPALRAPRANTDSAEDDE